MKHYLLIISILSGGLIHSQTQFWSDDFESAAPTGGSRTPNYSGGSGGPPNTRYFKQTTLANIAIAPSYSAIQGTQCWAAEDVDAAPTGIAGEQSSEQFITWSGINITGKFGLSFRGAFATTLATVWDHGTATTLTDYLRVEYCIDAGTWTNLLVFYPNAANATTGALAVDSNNDGLGDGLTLTSTFTDFTVSIPGTGTTMQLRVTLNSNSLAEEMAIDNFRLLAITSLPVELTGFGSSCENGQETVSWTSETESFLQQYELERSDDAQQFERIATVTAAGSSQTPQHYEVQVPAFYKAPAYYRLRMVDMDGTFKLSQTIAAVNCGEHDGLLHGFFTQDGELGLIFSETGIRYEVLTADGQKIAGKTLTDGQHKSVESVTGGHVYVVRIMDEMQQTSEVHRIFVP